MILICRTTTHLDIDVCL